MSHKRFTACGVLAFLGAACGPSDQARPLPTAPPTTVRSAAYEAAAKAASEKPAWELVATSGRGLRFVYVPAKLIRDRGVIAAAIRGAVVLPPAGPVEVDIFDDRARTPAAMPFTDAQMAHWRAQYSKNGNGRERFVWIQVRGGRVTSTPDTIRP